MSFLYFAYGSNLWPPQMRSRCPSAVPVRTATLPGWSAVYNKPSFDGSAKLNIEPTAGSGVAGVLYRIDDTELGALDAAEPGYTPKEVEVMLEDGSTVQARTYRWEEEPSSRLPYDWYVAVATAGARHHGLDPIDLEAETIPDPIASGIRPVANDDLESIRGTLSDLLTTDDGRYSVHPGDVFWWLFHSDSRYPDHLSFWVQDNDGVLVIDSRNPEINVFSRDRRVELVAWAQRRLGGKGNLAWTSASDKELVSFLRSEGYRPIETDNQYSWDLTSMPVPEPSLPDGWTLRSVDGPEEADNRRSASHAAFKSAMDPVDHLDRYLGFMNSPVYEPDRDLVAVSPEGRIAAFIVWWPDKSGVAQIEPFGTHPDFHRQGVGRALMYYALRRMADSGMKEVRVVTNDWREDATGFYEGVGFSTVGPVQWWAPSDV